MKVLGMGNALVDVLALIDNDILLEELELPKGSMQLIDEVKKIYQKYQSFPTAMQGLGYKEVVEYLEGKISKDDMIEKIKQETRRYAKRQLTWFRKNKQTIWLDAQDKIQNNIKIILEG